MLTKVSTAPSSGIDVQGLIQQREAWKHTGFATLLLAYGSLGVIYGDIGTSPLYAMAGIFSSFEPNEQDILGAISLIFWSITLIVLLKYVLIVLRANDHGEGGTFAMYTRLCRIIGIGTGTTSSMGKSEHAAVLQTAALAGKIREATSLARATRAFSKVLSKFSRLSKQQRTRAEYEAEAVAAAAAAAIVAEHVPDRKLGLIHRWAFPSGAIKLFFQGSAGARGTLLTVSVLATSMVVGDGVLTPAISVVSAVQGLAVKTSISQDGIIGISVAILVGLFMLQSLGTQRVAFAFSPIVVVWMLSILIIGCYNLGLNGGTVLQGLSPHYIVTFFNNHGTQAWESLGGVMLCLTGAEALFADLGHFSIGAVAVGFSFFVYPCIIFAYLGQGAHLINHPEDVDNAFWATVPDAFFWPMLVIATCTAIVASQALISGAFSIIRQAMTLGVFPPLQVVHTGEEVEGQIYVGFINFVLMLLSIAVVAGFGGDGTKIGNAYGIAVATVMLITTGLLVLVMLVDWEISALLLVPFAVLFLIIEGGLLTANLIKVPQGGWFTIAVSSGVAFVMFVWMSGQHAKAKALMAAKHSTTATIASLLTTAEVPNGDGGGGGGQLESCPESVNAPRATAKLSSRGGGDERMSSARDTRSSPGGSRHSLATRTRKLGADLQPSPAAAAAGAAPPPGARVMHRAASLQQRAAPSVAPSAAGLRRRSDDGATDAAYAPVRSSSRPLSKVCEEPDSSIKRSPSSPLDPLAEASDEARDPLVRIAVSSDGRGKTGDRNGGPGYGYAASGTRDLAYMPTTDVLDLLQSSDECVGLAKLRGMGIYYADSAHGLPPVMWHFLRNVEAVHEVMVLLQNQFLPIPHLTSLPGVDASHRFGGCTLVAGVPHMYRVVALYGYMDVVDNGPEFVELVKDFIKKSIRLHATTSQDLDAPEALGTLSQEQQAEAAGLLDKSHEQGVVYYMGRTRLRMRKLNNDVLQILHNVWYGDLYRFLAINAWDKVETWSIPHNNMVEIAMVLEI